MGEKNQNQEPSEIKLSDNSRDVRAPGRSYYVLDLRGKPLVSAESLAKDSVAEPAQKKVRRIKKDRAQKLQHRRADRFEVPERLTRSAWKQIIWHEPERGSRRRTLFNFLVSGSHGQNTRINVAARWTKRAIRTKLAQMKQLPRHPAKPTMGMPTVSMQRENTRQKAFFPSVPWGFDRAPKILKLKEARAAYAWGGSMVRSLVWFFVCSAMIVVPVHAFSLYQNISHGKDEVVALGSSGVEGLRKAGESLKATDIETAANFLLAAQENFRSARKEYDRLSEQLAGIIQVIPDAAVAGHFLALGQAATEAGQYLAQGLQMIALLSPDAFVRNTGFVPDEERRESVQALPVLSNSLSLARLKLDEVQHHLSAIEPDNVPETYRADFESIKGVFPSLRQAVEALDDMVRFFVDIFGFHRPRSYLVVFQNNAELRPTGGFIGSLAIVDINRGHLSRIEVPGGGSYDFQGSLTAGVAAPEPLWLVEPRWQFHDANWWPDFPTSARKLMWFYEHSGGNTVDGVIALTPEIVEGMLEITGPIDMPDYGLVVTSENFRVETQHEVELRYEKVENRPKAFIGDLTMVLLERLLSGGPDMLLPVLALFEHSLSVRDMQLYFRDQALQQQNAQWGWSGEVLPARRDYLAVIEANIGGGKTDLAIERAISHAAEINEDGSVSDTVEITRSHKGDPQDIFQGITNNAYVRIYIPAGSVIKSAEGFGGPGLEHFKSPPESFAKDSDLARIQGEVIHLDELGISVWQEFGKTVVGGWQVVHPGESKTIRISYQLPWQVIGKPLDVIERILDEWGWLDQSAVWSLFVQRQAGVSQQSFVSTVVFPKEWDIAWKSDEMQLDGNRMIWSGELLQDKGLGSVFKL